MTNKKLFDPVLSLESYIYLVLKSHDTQDPRLPSNSEGAQAGSGPNSPLRTKSYRCCCFYTLLLYSAAIASILLLYSAAFASILPLYSAAVAAGALPVLHLQALALLQPEGSTPCTSGHGRNESANLPYSRKAILHSSTLYFVYDLLLLMSVFAIILSFSPCMFSFRYYLS